MIAYVLKMWPRFSETFILQEILELERRGRSITIVSLRKPDDGRFHEELASVAARAVYLPEHAASAPGAFLGAHARAFGRAPGTWLRAAGLALRTGKEGRAGFVRAPLAAEAIVASGATRIHAHFASMPGATAMFASMLAGIPFTVTAHAKDIYLDSRSRTLLREILARAARLVTVSDFNRRFLAGIAAGTVPPDRIAVVHNSVDCEQIRPADGPGARHPRPLILAVGRLVEKKGFELLVEACGRLEDDGVDFRCEIVGKGPLESTLRERIARLRVGGRVALIGARSRRDVVERLRSAAVLAAPCVVGRDGNRDGLPTVILEAMACGVPVVSTPVTGIPEAVADGETGFLVAPGDAAALADALARLLASPELRERFGRAGREACLRTFDLRRNVDALVRIFDETTERGERDDPAVAAVGGVGR